MMDILWVVLFVALTGSHLGYGSPVRPTPQTYPHNGKMVLEGWGTEGGLYAAVPALALMLTAVGLLFGCTWCYRHKDCKPNEGAENQLFTATASHLHSTQRIHPPDSGFSEPANNNISEDNNNGPISLREMQNIANNNATAYIVSENEERNRVSRESVVEFEPLPSGIRVVDPLEHCADWFGGEDFSRNHLQYLREIGRGWFGRVVEGEIEDSGATSSVAVKILNQNASLEDKARFLDEARVYRDVRHENILGFIAKCLQEDPWILIFEFCPMDLQQYLIENRPKMAILNESGVQLRLMCDVTSALSYLHSRGHLYGNLWSGSVLVRGVAESGRAVLGHYSAVEPHHECIAPEIRRHGAVYTGSSEVWALGALVWEVCAWGAAPAPPPPPHPPPPDLPCPYRNHLYQVMQLCWNPNPDARPTSAQVHALINHLYTTHTDVSETSRDDGYGSSDFEERWQRLKPNTIPKIDEHVAIIHAPSTSMTSHFTGSDQEFDNIQSENTLSVDMDTAVSRSSSIMSDKDPLSVQIKSESLTNLHGSLEDVRNIYLTHNEMAILECHQGNISLDDCRDKDHDRSDSSLDPWLKDIIAGSQDDVSYYKDVSDVIKNLDNILNSEKTSSSESSHQASPSRDNLSLDCKKDYPMQSSMVKSPGISNFQNVLVASFDANTDENEPCDDDDADRDTIGTLSHSFERHSDTISQHTLENLTPDTPMKDIDVFKLENEIEIAKKTSKRNNIIVDKEKDKSAHDNELPNKYKIVNSDRKIPKLMELCIASMPSVSGSNNEQLNVRKDCQTSCDNNLTELRTDNKDETKSIDDIGKANTDSTHFEEVEKTDFTKNHEQMEPKSVDNSILPKTVTETLSSNDGIDILRPYIEDVSNIVQRNETFEVKHERSYENCKTPASTESNNFQDEILVSNLIDTGSHDYKEPVKEISNQVAKHNDYGIELKSTTENVSKTVQENHMFIMKQDTYAENVKIPLSIESNDRKDTILVSNLGDTATDYKEQVRDLRHQTAENIVKLDIDVIEGSIEDVSVAPQDKFKMMEKTHVEDVKIPVSTESNAREGELILVNDLVNTAIEFPKEPVREVCNQAAEINNKLEIYGFEPTIEDVSNTPQGVDTFEVKENKTFEDHKIPISSESNVEMIVNDLVDTATVISKEPVRELCNQAAESNIKLEKDEVDPIIKDVFFRIPQEDNIFEMKETTNFEDLKIPASTKSDESKDEMILVDNATDFSKEPLREPCKQSESNIRLEINDVNPTIEDVSNTPQQVDACKLKENINVEDIKLLVPNESNDIKEEMKLVNDLVDIGINFSKEPVRELCNQAAESNMKTEIDDVELIIEDEFLNTPQEVNILEVKENTNDEDHKIPVSTKSIDSNVAMILVETVLDFSKEPVREVCDKSESNIKYEIDDVEPTIEDVSNTPQQVDTCELKENTIVEDLKLLVSKSNDSKSELILVNDLVDTATNLHKESVQENTKQGSENIGKLKTDDVKHISIKPEQTPESVQNFGVTSNSEDIEDAECKVTVLDVEDVAPTPVLPPDVVQIIDKEDAVSETAENKDNGHFNEEELNATTRSDNYVVIELNEQSNDNSVYMDLINSTNSENLKDSTIDDNMKNVLSTCLDASPSDNSFSIIKNDSTEYLDLPSFVMIQETDNFLHMERMISSKHVEKNICSSTPIGSDSSAEAIDNALENSVKENNETLVMSDTKVPDYEPVLSFTKLEQKCVPENLSPFESPTKSHPTDTYDENSSVVLGPFENCTIELFKGIKSNAELVELPKEELLAFSSNFSEINLETPSPLRDVNFLNEVPDIAHDDLHFDDIQTVNEPIANQSEPQTENNTDSGQAATEKRVSPSTPPNSPGIFLASTSQDRYIVDIDLNNEVAQEPDSNINSLQNEIDLNQIELQITSKLAMAENENNLNIEYSGPLTVEGLVSEDSVYLRESDVVSESYLAGNGGPIEDVRTDLTLDEECVKALRNELELKLPLAQVAAIEPPCEGSWPAELPPPPELVVSYPGALSPIAEETGQQLSAYENDINWNTSVRTDSSESYPEPCNNSTDEVTDLPTGLQTGPHDPSTYTIISKDHSQNNTYTVQRDVQSSRELTMSADSLNVSPYKTQKEDTESPIDDRTYNKHDYDKESSCERISQVSPFLVSPTTDTSAPDNSDNFDNATGVSTLSKTTLPTDAKLSKPSECLSKATSIDSWCSNDTLYNVEENFDDLAMDSDVPLEFEPAKEEGNSESTDTLTHNDDEKELSHCSTYIIHDSKSEACETFSPDSITANDNNTYTKVKTEAAGTTPSVITKSDVNDSTKNTQTRDLAYGTLMSGLPSFSNCTTEAASGLDDAWKLPQPEMVRRSPIRDDANITPPELAEEKAKEENSPPQIVSEPCIKKMDSFEISCLQDNLVDGHSKLETLENQGHLADLNDSSNSHFRNMAMSLTSTPLIVLGVDDENTEAIPMHLPDITTESQEYVVNIPNFRTFQRSVEVGLQDFSSNASNEAAASHETEILLEGESKTLSRNSNRDSLIMSERSLIISERSPTYSEFENSASTKVQDVHSKDKSSQSMESGINSEEFRNFENSVRNCPQDLSSIDASNLLLKSERISSEQEMGSSTNIDHDMSSQSGSRMITNQPMQSLDISPPNDTNLIESHDIVNNRDITNIFLINFDMDDEMEQPHSIIITEAPLDTFIQSPNRTYDSHTEANLIDLNHTYDSHTRSHQVLQNDIESMDQFKINGEMKSNEDLVEIIEHKSPTTQDAEDKIEKAQPNTTITTSPTEKTKDTPNQLSSKRKVVEEKSDDLKRNGNSANYAIVNFLSETFEELPESNVDDNDSKDVKLNDVADEMLSQETTTQLQPEIQDSLDSPVDDKAVETPKERVAESLKEELEDNEQVTANGVTESEEKMVLVTDNFLQNEKKFCQLHCYIPMLSDIRFTGPAEIMSTSFTQDSPTEATSTECEQDSKPDTVADILKEWDSDSDSHTSNSSSGEFIWKDGDGHETSVVPSTHFDHQRGSGPPTGGSEGADRGPGGGASEGSGGSASGSGSEGDEVEFVPSSWDCRAAPSKSSLRSLQQAPLDSKKRVVFKRQKYHCVYEYPREAADLDTHSPAYLPDLSTYSEWDPRSAEEAELCYGRLFAAPGPLALGYPLRAGIAFGADYDEDFFISSSARPFESLGIMSTTSQFFPGMHVKPMLERDLSDDVTEEFPPPPSPIPPTTLVQSRTPSLDFTTPDSGVEDITPGSTTDDEFKTKKLPETELTWRPVDSASSSESVSPSSPGGEALGGLRHTRDKLKLDLPPSPHIPSPRHNRVFNFVLEKPKRRPDERSAEIGSTPLIMTDETPIVTNSLPLPLDEDLPAPEPTFSTFGKCLQKIEPEQKIILTHDVEGEDKIESPKVVEAVKGEGTVLDSGDEDSGIESSSKATLERNKTPNVS